MANNSRVVLQHYIVKHKFQENIVIQQ